MKYMVMTFGSAEAGLEAMGKEWMLEMFQFMHKLDEDLKKSGELVDAQGLADCSQAKTVRLIDGAPVPTDGPFAEAKESLVGYWIVDVDSEARALEIASRIVAFVKVPIEVRRVMDAPPDL
ncbi:MAG TPA: YciI family protein [Candidatus Dormibacteraeota bacterium]|nr:YciI family protein [Candidatus Dormibacteraeota bacterium]